MRIQSKDLISVFIIGSAAVAQQAAPYVLSDLTGQLQNLGYDGTGIPALGTRINIAPGGTAELSGVRTDAAGNVYFADYGNHRVRMIEAATGLIKDIAGTGVPGSAGDGGDPKLAQLNYPQ